MVVDSSRVDVGRTVADEEDSAGEGEEYAEVEDMKCVRVVWDWENRLGSRNKLLL